MYQLHLSSTNFYSIFQAIGRLGGHPMKQECDKVKTKILDQTNQEIMLDIKRSNDEIKELKQSVESLKIANADFTMEVEKLKDTVPWNVRAQFNQILIEWKENDRMFITTRAAKHVLTCIKENSCVTITASSGVGKTATLRHVVLQMAAEGFDVLLVTNPGDIVKFYNPNHKTLFVIDDLCGNYSLNQTDIKIWEPFIDRITKILTKNLAKIITACRFQVYQDDKFKSLSIFKSCVCNLLSDSMCLTKVEKESIAEIYLKTKALDVTDCYDLYDCFPLLCKLYRENPSLDIRDFFCKPFSVYEQEIDMLQIKGFPSKYCALALCVIFNNNLMEETLTEEVNEETRAIIENTFEACKLDRGTSRLVIQDELNSLIHTFLKKEQNIYKTIHDKIFDFLVYYFGKKIINCLIKNAHSGLINERFLLQKQENADQFISIVPPKYHQRFIQRMIDDWSKGEVIEVFCNMNMEIPQFKQRLLSYLNGLETSYQRQLAHTCDVHYDDTVLLQLCFDGHIPMISWCFNHSVDVNQCRNNEMTPLHVAVSKCSTKIVRMLLDIRADYNKCESSGWSPVMRASFEGHTEIVRILLDVGANYNKCENDGWSPLMFACTHGHTEIVSMLLDIGADYDKCANDGWSPVMLACSNGHTEIVKMLLDIGADYNKCGNDGWSPVICACSEGHTKILRMLLDIGADYNKCKHDGWSPVMFSCSCGYTEIVRILLDVGANYNKCENDGWSPLMVACTYGHTEIVSMLLDIGADYDKCENDGWSPVMLACSNGHTEIVRMLLDIGADYNKCGNDGWSPVICACSEGHTNIVSMLLDIGADYNKCKHDGWSPVMFSCSCGYTELVRMLLDIGADYNECENDGWSP
ncbi:ankyrin-3-like [Mytilus californianus]|uniref:ankyrin-3-like n=1 Tax=Mytilus californianus TaxID=6549 RepID=UPI0022481328|nr:ankyrin-3-like [Mytilus californianus]